jgi:hypothetical protein
LGDYLLKLYGKPDNKTKQDGSDVRLGDPLAAGHTARAHIYNAARRLRLAGVE